MIDVKHLSKSFGDHLVLDDISEHVSPGENVVIIGPSGSSKSMTFGCMASERTMAMRCFWPPESADG